MPAYIIIHNTVLDPEAMSAYVPKAIGTFGSHGAALRVIEEASTLLEGACDHPRTIVLEFESREKAQAWYGSPEYQEILPIRLGATNGFAVLVDGFEG